jgi:hypothetical protein
MLHVSALTSEDKGFYSKYWINRDDTVELILDPDVSNCEQPDSGVYDNWHYKTE